MRLAKQRLDEFMIGFSAINKKLREVFRMLTIQGQAELELVDSMDPFSDVRNNIRVHSIHFARLQWCHPAGAYREEFTLIGE